MTDEEGLKYAVQHVCLNCSELGECDKCVHCEFLKIVRECYDDAIEIGRKKNGTTFEKILMIYQQKIKNAIVICIDKVMKSTDLTYPKIVF